MPLSDDLLKPIAGANPAGADLRYDPLYDKIKEARREDDDAPQGEWERTRKVADWAQVVKLTSDAIGTKTKDLQLAAWLTEAVIRREGFPGLHQGLNLLKGLTEQFWDQLYPELEDGDAELRAAPLEWVGTRLELPLKMVPLNKSGHDYLRYKESRTIPTEAEAEADDKKGDARRRAIEDGKIAPEEFDKAFAATPKPYYKQLAADLKTGQATLQALETLSNEKFGDSTPNFIPLRNTLEELERTAAQLLGKKLELEPDPVEAGAATADAGAASGGAGGTASTGAGVARALSAEPTDPADATSRVVSAARFLRQHDATSPASYLLLRALRWGEVRAQGANVDPRLLDAPTSQARTQLKTLMLDQDWPGLLEATESVMATPAGRGWLDLQRYALNACAGMGPEFEFVTRAIRSELKLLLADVPGLAEMALMDDLPTAGPSTLTWLKAEGLLLAAEDGEGADAAEPSAPAQAMQSAGAQSTRDRLLERAMAEIKAGRPQKAIEMVKRELDREQSRRGRFLRQVQLARVMCEAGLDAAAIPLLEEMATRIDEHKLEDWETGTLVAEPLALLHRAMARTSGDEAVRQALYLRIVKLDPVLALGFSQSGGNGEG